MSDLLADALLGTRHSPAPDALATAHRRAQATQVMLALYAAVVLAVATWYAFDPLLSNPGPDVLITVWFLATAGVFGAWQIAAYRLVPALSGEPAERSEGWAIGGYVVPIMNLWVPYQVVREIRDASDPSVLDGGFGAVERRGPPIRTWWTLWIVSTVSNRVFSRIPEPAVYGTTVSAYEILAVIALVAQLAVSAAALVVVRRIDQDQQALAARLATVPALA